MKRKNTSLILAIGIAAFQCAKLSQPQEAKIILPNQPRFEKVVNVEQHDSPKFPDSCKFKKQPSNNDLDKSKCSGCIFANNCSGCVPGKNNDANGWISLNELPQLDSLTIQTTK